MKGEKSAGASQRSISVPADNSAGGWRGRAPGRESASGSG